MSLFSPMPRTADAASPGLERLPSAVVVGVVLAGLLALTVGMGLWHLRNDTLDAQSRALASLATASADELERGMQGVKLAMQVTRDELREGRIVPGRPEASAQLHTRSLILSRVRKLWVVDAGGSVLAASSLAPPPGAGSFLPDPLRLGDEGMSFSVPFLDTDLGQPAVAMAVRYGSVGHLGPDAAVNLGADNEPARGWVVAEIQAPSLLGSFPRAALAPDARMAVQRGDGVVLAGTLRQDPRTPTEPAIDDRPDANAVQVLDDGSTRIVQVRHMPSLDLRLVMTRDVHEGLRNWRELAQGSLIALVLVYGVLTALLVRMLRAERARRVLSVKLGRVRKLESLGTLAGGVAHDFNNILASVQGYGEMARGAAPAGSTQARHLDQVLQAAARGKAVVARILGFSRSGTRSPTVFAVQPVVEQVLGLLAATMAPGIRVERPAAGPPLHVRGDATLCFEAVMNLCSNALQAMPGQAGVLSVEVREQSFASEHWTSHGSVQPGRYVALRVADTGVGIAPDVMDRLFEPFFTTRGRAGTGLGLAVVHGMVEDVGGGVDVQSRPGHGSAFTLYLPWAAAPSPAEQPEPAHGTVACAPMGQGQVVLVVDDEAALVALTEESLAQLGYEPVGHADPLRALEALRAEPARFDLLLTDELMPQLPGTQLAQQARALRPDLPVVLLSGWGGAQLAERAAAAGISRVLTKPVEQGELAAVLADLLNRPDDEGG